MPTAKQITQEVIQDLIDLEIIKLLHPETRNPLPMDSTPAQNVIAHVAAGCTEAIKLINDHRPLDPEPTITHMEEDEPSLDLMAPFPGMDEDMSQEKIDELNFVLDQYEKVSLT